MNTLKQWQQLWSQGLDYMFILLAEADSPEAWDTNLDDL
jgi:hypothetical protein